VLHTDAAIFADRLQAPPDAAPPAQRTGRRQEPPPPLLFHDRYVEQTDGRIIGEVAANWNWPFARSLVDLLVSDRAFAGQWYHAVGAYMMAAGDLADLKTHLQHAADVLPDDPGILFDRACRAEILGLSFNQAVRDDRSYPTAAANAVLPLESKTNAEAEARVRLARLLQQRGQSDEGMSEIEHAFTDNLPRVVAFLAHLVGGRIESARGRAAASLVQYRAAMSLYPDAQSALLGASEAAVMTSDVAEAQALVGTLGRAPDAFEKDPWWSYHLGPGRDVDALVGAVWARVRQQRP
jgi:tetratricopeptide (TPR) repeat protein